MKYVSIWRQVFNSSAIFVGALFLNILDIAGRFAVDCVSVQVNRVSGVKWVVEGQLPFCEEK